MLDNTTLKAIGAQCELEINTKESKLRKRHVCDFLVCSLRTVMNSPPWDILGTLFVTYREESPNIIWHCRSFVKIHGILGSRDTFLVFMNREFKLYGNSQNSFVHISSDF